MNRLEKLLVSTYAIAAIVLLLTTAVFHDGDRNSLTFRVVVVASAAIVLTLLLVGILLYASNRRLKEANKVLFERTMEELESGRQAKEREGSLMEEIDALNRRLAEKEAPARPRYESSSLAEDQKNVILSKINHVMENSEEIFSNDFSLSRLAELVGYNYKYVSQAINDAGRYNFSSKLNEYRIKEACRRLSDVKEYGGYTIEAVAESVGFKSRSNFVTTFKRVTGITPSEFQRMAKENAGRTSRE